jgi:TonB family protein
MADAYENLPLGLLPERKINWFSVSTSYVAQTLFVIFLVQVGLIHPNRLAIPIQHLVYTPLVSSHQQLTSRPTIKPHLLPPAPATARLVVPREMHALLPKAAMIEPPKINIAMPKASIALVKPGGALPAAIVHTGSFSGSSATPTVNRPVEKVQTGGFGDPNGIPGQGKSQNRLVMANLGSFDLPQGAGYGNGSGGARGVRGTVASAGFGNGIASPGQGDGRSSGRGAVQPGGFGDASKVTPAARPRQAVTAPNTTPVEILSKPKPVYTEEARQLKLEGEVLVEVLFAANGQVTVSRVVRGLGHGLDEAAVAAAQKIRFKPAQQNGQAVDSAAVVHVLFQLAY